VSLLDVVTYKRIEELEDVNKVVELQSDIWSRDVVSPQPQLLASIHHGGIIIGAFVKEILVGFCYGFAGFKENEAYLVSHMTGILPDYQNAGIGYQLKVMQRDWAINYGYNRMVWTFDPLEIRNGYFNVCKLGAYSKCYIPSYYGEMKDKLNKGLPSDRLLIVWDLRSKRVEDAVIQSKITKTEKEYKLLLNWEQLAEYTVPIMPQKKIEKTQGGYRVPVPTNIQSIKQQNSELALAWRYAVRAAISEAFANGFRITGVQKEQNSTIHFYILET
jgi:predicted GNAT superfamily acetyltransferase